MTDEIPKNYDSERVERKWRKKWKDMGIYAYDPNSNKPTYSIDTPPPYVSGDLHVGHAMSYTQAEFIARYKRMRGFNVFYPMGFDDNGLPTERYVERKLELDKHDIGRTEFIKKCVDVTEDGRKNYRNIWDLLGISVDWNLLYTTISDESQRVSQLSFIDLYEKGHMYRKEDPVIWCPNCKTGLAQADIEDDEKKAYLNHITFPFVDSEEKLEISTTRPELLSSCVGVFVHPEDKRYSEVVGEKVEVPIFGQKVEIREDHKVDPEFGSGAVMVCTFGDKTDIEWWKDHGLDLKISINEDGTMNKRAEDYHGLRIEEAREKIVEDLSSEGFIKGRDKISHAVQVHERCDSPIEYYLADQWFVNMLDKKEELKQRAEGINWYPEFMKKRFDEWTDGLKWDWCVSRQRFYGVPFPVWYCDDCNEIILADEKDLPVQPSEEPPSVDVCPECGNESFEPETDVMDTWYTSSLTPLINSHWRSEEEKKGIYPMDLRPQGYDIIRTWAFYTILKSHLHTDSIPWKDIMISGMGMAEEGKSFSKSKGIVVQPEKIVEKYSADALRWWSSKVKLGEDLVFREDDLVAGQKLTTKLWNVARFLNQFIEERPEKPEDIGVMDKWLLMKLDETIEVATDWFETYQYNRSKEIVKQFFWHDMADNYLEIVKKRLYDGDGAAKFVMYRAFLDILKMMAPVMPFITEEIYDKMYSENENKESIHSEEWPEKLEAGFEHEYETGELGIEVISAFRKYKSRENMSLNHEITEAKVFGPKNLSKVKMDIKEAMSIQNLELSDEEPKLERKISSVDLDYSVVGPKYGEKVKDIEEKIETISEDDIKEGKLEIMGTTLVEGEEFEVDRKYSLKGEKGDIVQTENCVVLINRK